MAQPKLSNQSVQQLLAIGPLAGLDATTDAFLLDNTYARDLLNFVPNHAYKGISPIRGRIGGSTFLNAPVTSLAIYYASGKPPSLVAATALGNLAYSNFQSNNPVWQLITIPPSPSGDVITGSPGSFVRYKGWLFFTNADPNAICYKFDKDYNATFWGISPPAAHPMENITSPNNGMIYGDAYYYRYTYKADGNTDPGLNQESSPSPPAGPFNIGTPLGPPASNSATIAQTPAPTLGQGTGGSIPDGTYIVGTTWVTGAGESGISVTAQITVSGGSGAATITIAPQSPPAGATGWNVYTGTTANALTQQNGTRSGTGSGVELSYTTTGGAPPPYTGFLNPPSTPVVSATSGGSQPARTEYFQTTYVNGNGETTPSPEVSINLLAGQVAVVQSPGANANATGWNVYGSTTSAQEILQNSSPIALGTSWTEPNSGRILGQSAVLTLVGSPDPQVTKINIYRIGGQSLGNWYYVGSVANPGGGNTTTFTDNIPDSAVTGQALVLARDPPAPFVATFEYVERIWGFGYPIYTDFNGVTHYGGLSMLWYSNYAEPWGFDNTNQVIPVGNEDAGDIAINGGGLSSMGILWKSKTMWAIYGQSPSDFFVTKLFDIGAVSRTATMIALGTAFWLSQQGVYMFDGSTLTYLSKAVKAILDSFSEADFQACTTSFDDRIAWFSFPTQGISLGYDTVDQNWWKASLSTSLFAFDTEGQSRPAAPDYVFGVRGDTVDQWFADTKDLNQPIVASLTTRLGSSGPQIGTLRARYIELVASANISNEDSVTVTVTANPAGSNHSFSKTFGKSPVNLRQRASVPPGIQGDELQLQVTSSSSDGLVLDSAAVHGWIRRLYNIIA
jgi:hypothetical protein